MSNQDNIYSNPSQDPSVQKKKKLNKLTIGKLKYSNSFLKELIEKYEANLLKNYEDLELNRDSQIIFRCKCNNPHTKSFRSIERAGAYCKTCQTSNMNMLLDKWRYNNLKYEDTLEYKYPEISKQWHPTKNGIEKPQDYKSASQESVWWLCDKKEDCGCAHEWEASISNRTYGDTGCPFCCIGVKKVCIHNSFGYKYPEIAKQWHPTKNNKESTNYSYGSNEIVWWLCDKKEDCGCAHEWEASIYSIISNTSISGTNGCPFCNGCCGNKPICCNNNTISNVPVHISKTVISFFLNLNNFIWHEYTTLRSI